MDRDTWSVYPMGFDDIKRLDIKQLEHKIESVEKITLEHKYKIPRQWAYDAYIDLCSRQSPLTSDEAERLGIGEVGDSDRDADQPGEGEARKIW